MKNKILIIVESPTKVKTIKKFLDSNYQVESSVGHVRDLPKKNFGIDLDNHFEPQYEDLPDKKEVIANLKRSAKGCALVYLCPDPDREGEAIAWHTTHILPSNLKLMRATFNSITKQAVEEGLTQARKIDQTLVEAQQARRLLDRIVGYKISPILQRRITRKGGGTLSAGRVQSVTLKLVVDREQEIELFRPVEYWNLTATLLSKDCPNMPFEASLYSVEGRRLEKDPASSKQAYYLSDEQTTLDLLNRLKNGRFKVENVTNKARSRHPTPPFITSTLQQEASRHFSFSASRTMRTAQTLYEGVEIGREGTEGLITYMRTDSVRCDPTAIQAAREWAKQRFGASFIPDKPRVYTTKKSAQDAHEAIRPTFLHHTPEKLQPFLSRDQFKLYQLIYRRFVASQMKSALYDTVVCDLTCEQIATFRATGSTLKFKGFLSLYEEKNDQPDLAKEPERGLIPPLREGDLLELLELSPKQSFTKPPPRFTEASLVKELEILGVGRPSTYAATMNTIQSRAYVEKEKLTLHPTDLGRVIAQMLERHFPLIMDISFTARMEDGLDKIAEGNQNWRDYLQTFWDRFAPLLTRAEKEAFVPKELTDIDCPKCGSKLHKIWAKSQYFYGCSNYPDCSFTVSIEALNFNKTDYNPDFDWDQRCPKCAQSMLIRFGRFGAFLGCSTYPDCKGIVNIPKKDELPPGDMPTCPALGCDGKLTQRRSRFGKPFFSCSDYPQCDVIVNKLDQLDSKYHDHPKTAYTPKKRVSQKRTGAPSRGRKRTSTAQRKGTRSQNTQAAPNMKLSPVLARVVGVSELPRQQVVKKVWDYIKKHDLQDPSNRRLIRPDQKLGELFGTQDQVKITQVLGLLSPHLSSL